MQHQGVGAFVTEYGGPNSHTAILARSLGIPAVVGVHDARRYLNDEELVIVDGREGVLLVAPEASIQRYYQRRQRQIKRIRAARTRLRKTPTVTQDGEAVVLQANVELPGDLQTAIREGAVGVGLYRTEFLFMNRDQPPDELEQHAAYAAVINAAKGAPVTIRTLDLGADKQVDGSRPGAPISQNPALGLRAVRLCLKEQSLFRPQLRAILRALRPRTGPADGADAIDDSRARAGQGIAPAMSYRARGRRRPVRSFDAGGWNDRGAGGRGVRGHLCPPSRFYVDRNQRSHPVHDCDRSGRR